jgi:hypothetical protein
VISGGEKATIAGCSRIVRASAIATSVPQRTYTTAEAKTAADPEERPSLRFGMTPPVLTQVKVDRKIETAAEKKHHGQPAPILKAKSDKRYPLNTSIIVVNAKSVDCVMPSISLVGGVAINGASESPTTAR